MAWTAPRTWLSGEIYTSSHFNVHVRDNLLETMPAKASAAAQLFQATGANAIETRLPVYKSADQVWNNTTTFSDATGMSWTVGASDYWMFWGAFYFDYGAGRLKYQWTVPASYTLSWSIIETGNGASASGAIAMNHNWANQAGVITPGQADPNIAQFGWVIGFAYGGGTGGTLQMQAAQLTAVASDSTLHQGSFLVPLRLR